MREQQQAGGRRRLSVGWRLRDTDMNTWDGGSMRTRRKRGFMRRGPGQRPHPFASPSIQTAAVSSRLLFPQSQQSCASAPRSSSNQLLCLNVTVATTYERLMFTGVLVHVLSVAKVCAPRLTLHPFWRRGKRGLSAGQVIALRTGDKVGREGTV